MIANRHEVPRLQSIFYRDSYHKVLNWLLVEACIMLGLIIAILYVVFFEPTPHFYVTTSSGQIMSLPPGHQ